MREICQEGQCAGCMACVDACPKGAVRIRPGIEHYTPIIDQEKCIDCGRCVAVCQQRHPAEAHNPIAWFQGWAADSDERKRSSSGGFATSIARAFVNDGGTVCACGFANGRFGFLLVESQYQVKSLVGSKYVKSDPTGSYRAVKQLLKEGKRVLFIGLPCQVSAMLNYVGSSLAANLYTIDLICHGTPSPQLLEEYLRAHGCSLGQVEGVSFREKTRFRLCTESGPVDPAGLTDRYIIAFLSGLSYTENCYSCAYAKTPRVSDLTLGDSWGSELVDEAPRGISLAICQSDKGMSLLYGANLVLLPVNAERAISNNEQLERPYTRPPERNRLIREINSGVSFEKAVLHCLPKQCIKQEIKRLLIRVRILK